MDLGIGVDLVLGIFMTFCADTTYPSSCKVDLKRCVISEYSTTLCVESEVNSCVFKYCYEGYFSRYFEND